MKTILISVLATTTSLFTMTTIWLARDYLKEKTNSEIKLIKATNYVRSRLVKKRGMTKKEIENIIENALKQAYKES